MTPQNLISYDSNFQDELKKLSNKKHIKKRLTEVESLNRRVRHFINSGGGISEFDLERYIGTNDLVQINYLERGRAAANSVCRLVISDIVTGRSKSGTGFLITPYLLITNNHVLSSKKTARKAVAMFEYESDIFGISKSAINFRLDPERCFITSDKSDLDYTICAINPISEDGEKSIFKYGFLRLIPETHKIDETEFVSIIQHPQGKEKHISIRDNRVIKIGDQDSVTKNNFIWYSSDTHKGSSGSPALNDDWQVVGLHHRSVLETKVEDGIEYAKLKNGTWIAKNQINEDNINDLNFIANEGIRTSKIIEDIVRKIELEPNDLLSELIDDVTGTKQIEGFENNFSVAIPNAENILLESSSSKRTKLYYNDRQGYNIDFLNTQIELPILTQKALDFGEVAEVQGKNNRLDYENYSVVFNAERKLAFYSVVNIDGSKWKTFKREGRDKWYYDPRIPNEIQLGNAFYKERKNYFDRGHLVRRLDPVWGQRDRRIIANSDTFHWTNCVPQYFKVNQGREIWLGLEDYILYNTDQEDVKATVFNGPIFDEGDEPHRGIQVPKHYWKIVLVEDKDKTLFSSAYLVSQAEYATNIPFEEIPVGEFFNYQTHITHIENLTGLSFPDAVKNSDVRRMDSLNIPLRSLADIQHKRR